MRKHPGGKQPVVLCVLVLLAASSGGCLQDVEPLVRIYNETDAAVDVYVLIREIEDGAPGDVAFEQTFHIGPQGSEEASVRLKGIYNVTASLANGTLVARDMNFWYGGYFGGQMYAWVTVEPTGLSLREQHAD
jgi:hypothetical protein